MRTSRLLLVLAVSWPAASSAVPEALCPDVVGTWRLVSYDERRPDGGLSPVWGPNPRGRLVYDSGGRMAVQLVDGRLGRFASDDLMAGTDEEVRRAFEGCRAYFGSYTVDASAGVIVHHVEASVYPNYAGTDLRRFFTLSGDRLTLRTPPILRGGRTSTYELVWEREG
jgi:hypothetical protein